MGSARHDAAAVREALNGRLLETVQALGLPIVRATSSRQRLRIGQKHGSLALELNGARRGLWHDFASGEGGDVLALIQRERGCDFVEALRWAGELLGGHVPAPPPQRLRPIEPDARDDAARTRAALEVWDGARPLAGSIAETYLRRRGIDADGEAWPDALRFHPRCPRGRDERLPALVALLRCVRTGEPRAVSRIFLQPGGVDRLRGDKAKMSLGPIAGAAVMLSDFEDVTHGLFLAEGVETAAALMFGFRTRPVWAACGSSNIRAFPILAGVEAITIAADNDAAEPGARNAGLEAARACAERWAAAGREARILAPKIRGDFNDALNGAAA